MTSKLKRWVSKFPDLGDVVARFPVTVAIMAIFTVLVMILAMDFWEIDEPIGRLLAGLVIAAYVSFCVTIARESQNKSRAIVVQIILTLVIAALACFSEGLRINLIMAVGAVLLILGNMILWQSARNDLRVWDFTHKIWSGAVFATVGAAIFVAGIMIIQQTLKSLFGLRLNDLTEHFILPIGLGFLAPLYWLATVPPVDEPYDDLSDNPGFVSKAIAFLGTWLLSPLTLIYALILLAYSVKIALAGELPKGEIAAMTTPFLLVGTLTWLLLEPPFINRKALARLFRKIWFPVSLPAVILLGISVWVRISEYGLTQERVALATCVVWALGIGLWFTFGPKTKRDIRLIPGSAALLLLIGTFTADYASLSSQSHRFEKNIVAATTVGTDGVVVKTDSRDLALKARGALRYLDVNNGLARANPVLKQLGISDEQAKDLASIEKALDLSELPSEYNIRNNTSNEHYTRSAPINLIGFDALMGPYTVYAKGPNQTLFETDSFKLSVREGVLTVANLETGVQQKTDLNLWLQGLYDAGLELEADTPTLDIFEEDGRRLKLVVERANASLSLDDTESAGALQSWSVTVYVLMGDSGLTP